MVLLDMKTDGSLCYENDDEIERLSTHKDVSDEACKFYSTTPYNVFLLIVTIPKTNNLSGLKNYT